MPLITLTTDFGYQDNYVGAMKGVILSICPKATIIDIAHGIPPQNIVHGAFVITEASKYYPPKTIHVVVVDPGVGSKRLPICVTSHGQYFIGPDNGLFSLMIQDDPQWAAYQLENKKFFLETISTTLHGRDIFAPVAAHLANGVKINQFGKKLKKINTLNIAKVQTTKNKVLGEIIYFDHYGNAITNIHQKDVNKNVKININHKMMLDQLNTSYETGELGFPLALISSSGFLEIAIKQGNAAKQLALQIGDTISLEE